MQDPKIWNMVSMHLSGEETQEEKEKFLRWLNDKEENKVFFQKAKDIWENKVTQNNQSDIPGTFRERFTLNRIKNFLQKQAIGKLIGFTIGMWVTTLFSYDTVERRSIKNLFGIAGRKKVVVHTIPEWLQGGIAILVGFIALELVNHFFQTKKHIVLWERIRGVQSKKSNSN